MAFAYPLPDEVSSIIVALIEKSKGNNPHELIKEYQANYDKLPSKKKKELEEKILGHYVLLIAKVAIKLSNKYGLDTESQTDLFQEGIIAFKKALKNFDFSRGNKFSTYLYRTLFSHLNRYIVYKMHLIVDKRFVYKKSEEIPDDEKIEITRITPENQNVTFYKTQPKEPEEIFDRELLEKVLKNLPPKVITILQKIGENRKLTAQERKLWKKVKPKLKVMLEREFGITSLEDFYF